MPKRKSANKKNESEQKKTKKEVSSANVNDADTEKFHMFTLMSTTSQLLSDLAKNQYQRNTTQIIENNFKEINKKGSELQKSVIFKNVLKVLVEDTINITENVFNVLVNQLYQRRIETLLPEELVHCLDLVSTYLIETNHQIDDKLETVVVTICRALATTEFANKRDEIFTKILNECSLNDGILIQLLSIQNKLTSAATKQTVEQIITKLIDLNKSNDYEISIMNKLLSNLFQSISIYPYLIDHAFTIYEQILLLVLHKRNKIDEKSASTKLEILTIELFVNHLKQNKNKQFIAAFQSVLNKNMLENGILDRFMLCLYLSVDSIFETNELNEYFASYLKNLIAISMEIKRSVWLQNCTIRNYSQFQLSNTFKYRLLVRCISTHVLTSSLFNLSKYLLDQIVVDGDERLNECIKAFAGQLIEEIFLNNQSNKEKLIEEYLNLCLKAKQRSFYIDLLQQMFEKESIKKIYNEQTTEQEKQKIHLIIISKLISNQPKHLQQIDSILCLDKFSDAIHLINSLKSFLFESKPDLINDLITYLLTDFKNESKNTITVYCLIHLVKAINTRTIRRTIREDTRLEQNYTNSIKILESLKEELKQSNDCQLKTSIYESFFSLIKHNSKLTVPIGLILLKQLKKYIIMSKGDRSKHVYFDLSKCFNQTELIEPIDVLFHCICVNMDKIFKQGPIHKNIQELHKIVDQISETYLNNSKTNNIDLLYASQINSIGSIHQIKQIHQIKFGLIDCLIENSLNNQLFSVLPKLIEYQELVQNSTSAELESLMINKPNTATVCTAKRKLFKDFTKNTKKAKLSEDKENAMSKPVLRERSRREPFGSLDNVPKTSKTAAQTSVPIKRESSFANMQLGDYEPRISLDCCLKLISLTQITSNKSFLNDLKMINNEQTKTDLITLITCSKFNEFIFKIIEKKLKIILNNKQLYDIQSKESNEKFQVLSQIWRNFYQRIIMQLGNVRLDKLAFKPVLPTKLNHSYLSKFQRCLNICMDIWKIVHRDYNKSLIHLISDEGKVFYAHEHGEVVWKFLLDCSNKIELLIKSGEGNSGLVSKCSAVLLKMINDIIDSVELSPEKLSNLNSWLCRIARKNISGEKEMTSAILELFVKISNKQFSSSVILKHLLLEYHNFISIDNQTVDDMADIEKIPEFNIINDGNSLLYHQFLLEQLQLVFDQIKWSIEFNNFFNRSKLINLINVNLESITMSFDFIIKSTTDITTVNRSLYILDKFYQFMIFFFDSKFINEFKETDIQALKRQIEVIYCNLQSNIDVKLNRINEILLINESDGTKLADSSQIINILNYKQLFSDLIKRINLLETKLCQFYDKYKDNNVIKEFKPYVSKITFNLDNRITKTISENQMNEIIQMNL